MHLKRLELNGFKSFAHKSEFVFDVPIIAIVGPNGSGKSNIVEAIRFVLGEQSVKSMRGKTGSDLIFKGSKEISKMSRASVSIVFDNSDRVFHLHQDNNQRVNIDFNEITITREVFVDGQNKYLINGNEVRMKDIHELIASVNIGSSGHHIISQGEADRYLNANVKDRRELIEEALGLKVYQYRIKESVRKLQRAEDNMRESELLRRELAPHLRFLKKQVDKLEKAKHLRVELLEQYKKYFGQEDYLIKKIEQAIDVERNQVQGEYAEVKQFLENYNDSSEQKVFQEELSIQKNQEEIRILLNKITSQKQELGRIEGMISLLEKQEQQSLEKNEYKHPGFSYHVIQEFLTQLLGRIDILTSSFNTSSIDDIKNDIKEFIANPSTEKPRIDNSNEIKELQDTKNTLLIEIEHLNQKIELLQSSQQDLQEQLLIQKQQEQDTQKQYYEYLAKKKELDGRRAMIGSRDESLGIRSQSRTEEYQEAKILLGIPSIDYTPINVQDNSEAIKIINAQNQETLRREIERIKIRIEDIGGGSGVETIKEYEETLERDQFLEKEIFDITTSINSLNSIIADLKKTLDTEFNIGVQKINDQFDKFFKLMFGGGKARLESAEIKKRRRKSNDDEISFDEDSEEDTQVEYGIDIEVQLPRKKVTDLDMLSGGERSLTSIALLFALSQVNPPPFLVLDETDAALDEANSQRYGDMVESLSKYSQLIVVTHNRETMSRAQTLFGVTVGRGDASTTLSLRLEDAAKYAK
jgi:chromosome segregation protein